jgi:hypothetical protein
MEGLQGPFKIQVKRGTLGSPQRSDAQGLFLEPTAMQTETGAAQSGTHLTKQIEFTSNRGLAKELAIPV